MNCYFSDQSEKLNQVTMIEIISKKNTGLHMNYKELIFLQRTKVLVLTTQKGVLYEWKKKTWKSLFGKKYLFAKPVHFSVKNIANNADTWGFIQQFFQHLYWTANSNGSWLRSRQHNSQI